MKTRYAVRIKDNPLYATWCTMIARCYRKTHAKYPIYGGRGITVCDEWRCENGAYNFLIWAINNGWQKGLTLDRINNDKDYCPSNCKWSTIFEQNNNKRNNRIVCFNGKSYSIANLAREQNVCYESLRRLISNKRIDASEAVEIVRRSGKTFDGTRSNNAERRRERQLRKQLKDSGKSV